MSTEIAQLQHRRDTAANWTSNNPTLAAGEKGIESDTGYEKTGDGATAWTGLKYTIASPLGVSGASRTVTAATVITTADNIVQLDASTAPIAQPLPASSGFTGKRITLSAITLGPNLVTVTPASGSINGLPSVTLGSPTSSAQYQSIDIVPLGANWDVV